MRIILESGSPRRRELLSSLGIEFEIDTNTNFKEYFDDSIPFPKIPELMSEGKSKGFHRPLEEDEILITADTVVILPEADGQKGEILGKPSGPEDARRMLRDLSGRVHQVITAVTIRDKRNCLTFSDTTNVCFKDLSDDEINYYIGHYSPFDKAGAYGIQEWIGLVGITRIEGSYFNVVGLPVHRLWEELQKFL